MIMLAACYFAAGLIMGVLTGWLGQRFLVIMLFFNSILLLISTSFTPIEAVAADFVLWEFLWNIFWAMMGYYLGRFAYREGFE